MELKHIELMQPILDEWHKMGICFPRVIEERDCTRRNLGLAAFYVAQAWVMWKLISNEELNHSYMLYSKCFIRLIIYFPSRFPCFVRSVLRNLVAAKVNILCFKQGKLYIRKVLKLRRYSSLDELYHGDARHSRSSLWRREWFGFWAGPFVEPMERFCECERKTET